MSTNDNGRAAGISVRSSDDEIAFYKHKIANSGRRKGVEGALVTASSMMAACAELFAFTLGEHGREIMMASLSDYFDRYPSDSASPPQRPQP